MPFDVEQWGGWSEIRKLRRDGELDDHVAKLALLAACDEVERLRAKVERREVSLRYIAKTAGVHVDTKADPNWASNARERIQKKIERFGKALSEAHCPHCGCTPTEADGSCFWCVGALNLCSEYLIMKGR